MNEADKCSKCCFTYQGLKYYPLEPTLDAIDMNDISHALSLNCRFSGQIREHYSIAVHSLNCMYYLDMVWSADDIMHGETSKYPVLDKGLFLDQFNITYNEKTKLKLMLHLLMHDASEAYLTDIPKPLKMVLPEYQRAEKLWEDKIAEKFELPELTSEETRIIKTIDYLMFRYECAMLWKVPQDEFLFTVDETEGYWQTLVAVKPTMGTPKDMHLVSEEFQAAYYKLKSQLKQLN